MYSYELRQLHAEAQVLSEVCDHDRPPIEWCWRDFPLSKYAVLKPIVRCPAILYRALYLQLIEWMNKPLAYSVLSLLQFRYDLPSLIITLTIKPGTTMLKCLIEEKIYEYQCRSYL